jgi:hypothetical protein
MVTANAANRGSGTAPDRAFENRAYSRSAPSTSMQRPFT